MRHYREGPHAFYSEKSIIFHYMTDNNLCDRLEWIYDHREIPLDYGYSLNTQASSLKSKQIGFSIFLNLLFKRGDIPDHIPKEASMTLNKFFEYYAKS